MFRITEEKKHLGLQTGRVLHQRTETERRFEGR